MEFRPCIDIHNGCVKQIVGSSLSEDSKSAVENFVANKDAAYYANLYKDYQIKGGHVILLNKAGSEYYDKTKEQALLALRTYPEGLQVGGGINENNAAEFLDAGASHVIVTSSLFENKELSFDRMKCLCDAVGADRLVFDLSCKRIGDKYYVCTDRWTTITSTELNAELLSQIDSYCDEFLIHAVDVEGKSNGIEVELVRKLVSYNHKSITYAGGIHSYADLDNLKLYGKGKINATIGSALDIFGGDMKLCEIIGYFK